MISVTSWSEPKRKGLKTALVGSGVAVNQCWADDEQRTEAWRSNWSGGTFKADKNVFVVASLQTPGWQQLGKLRCQVACWIWLLH